MKKLLFIIILISIGFLAFGQRENTLPRKASSAATDTIRVVKDNQSALMLRSVLQGAIYDSLDTHTDTLQALRADIDAGLSADLSDSITAHRTELNNLHDSIADHRIDIDANLDSIAVHRTELNNAVDSIADHRTEINANTTTGTTNATNISSNSVFIGVNTADIASLEDSIAKHTDTLQVHQDQIAALYDTTALHLDTLQAHNTRLLAVEGATSYTFDEGLTETAGNVDLGGAFDANILISSTNSNNLELRTGNGTDYSWMRVESGNTAVIGTYDQGTGNVSTIELDHSEMDITDEINSKGIVYGDDYSANYTARSLVDSAHIATMITGVSADSSWTSITTDTITEFTTDQGVLIESVHFEDSDLMFSDQGTGANFYTSGGDTKIITKASGFPYLEFYTGGILHSYMTGTEIYVQSGIDLFPSASKTTDIGSSSLFWNDGYFDRLYIDDASTYLDISSGDMTFTDANTGTKTLADLSASSDSSWISITVDTVKFSDTNTEIYEDGSNELTFKDAVSGTVTLSSLGSGVRMMKVYEAQVLYSNTAQTTIVTLPADAVVWDIQAEVRTAFNGSGYDYLELGVTGAASRYVNNEDISGTGFLSMSLSNMPDRMTGSTNITFQYLDQNADSSAGEAYVYVHYSEH